jgi:hypothetical protein
MHRPAGAPVLAAAAAQRIQPLIKGILDIHEKYR